MKIGCELTEKSGNSIILVDEFNVNLTIDQILKSVSVTLGSVTVACSVGVATYYVMIYTYKVTVHLLYCKCNYTH